MVNIARIIIFTVFPIIVLALSACSTEVRRVDDMSLRVDRVAKADGTLSEMENRFGVEFVSARLAAANYMINLKYKVIDPEKAAPLHNRKIDPYVVLERDGSRFAVPVTQKLGAIRSSPKFAKAGKNYFFFIGNPGGYIKSGDLITVVIGDFKLEHIAVL